MIHREVFGRQFSYWQDQATQSLRAAKAHLSLIGPRTNKPSSEKIWKAITAAESETDRARKCMHRAATWKDAIELAEHTLNRETETDRARKCTYEHTSKGGN